jgi:carboxylesterase
MKLRLRKNKKIDFGTIKMKGGEPIFIDRKSKVGVLMIHGFTSTPRQFREAAKYLAGKGLTIYAPLVAGHGTTPEDLLKTTPEDWKRSMKEAYLELKSRVKKIVVIGNSFGGNLALYLAREFDSDTLAGVISLGMPIKLKYQSLIKARYYLYGWMKKYYQKPRRIYKTDYTDMIDEITYPVIPIKSIMDFFRLVREETIPNLEKIKTPILIMHANVDPVVSPKSAIYIYSHIGSPQKLLYWFNSNQHTITVESQRNELFEKAHNFIKEIT